MPLLTKSSYLWLPLAVVVVVLPPVLVLPLVRVQMVQGITTNGVVIPRGAQCDDCVDVSMQQLPHHKGVHMQCAVVAVFHLVLYRGALQLHH